MLPTSEHVVGMRDPGCYGIPVPQDASLLHNFNLEHVPDGVFDRLLEYTDKDHWGRNGDVTGDERHAHGMRNVVRGF